MRLSNLAARVLFALVAIPVVLAAVYVGGIALALLLALAGAVAAWEYYRIARAAGYAPLAVAGVAIAALTPIAVHAYRLGRFAPPVLTLGAALVLILFALAIWVRGVDGGPIGAVATTIFGAVYTAGMLSFAYGLRYHTYTVTPAAGTALLAYPLVLTWTTDTAAYFVGRAIGRHKLIPAVSPGKTVEGAVAGLVACVVVSLLYVHLVLVPAAALVLTRWWAVLVGLVLGLAVQLGDLAESLIKREAGVKDSSHLIPGHGGVLDRLDSLLFALPTAYLLFTLPHALLPAIR